MGQDQSEDDKREEFYRHPDAATDSALDWFMRLQESPADPATVAAFERWHQADPQHEAAFARLERMHAMPALRQAAEKHAGLGAATIETLPSKTRRPGRPAPRWSRRAAAIAAVLVLAVGLWQAPSLILHWQADYMTATGEQENIRLPDGSTMVLNTASAVALDFSHGQRLVTLLSGEAYFDVRHDAAHPFRVRAGFSETEDIGTTFSVRRDGDADRVLLQSGRVEVIRLSDPSDSVALDPGERVVATAVRLSSVSRADPDRSLAWIDGRIVFHGEKFSRALASLRRYYDGSVILADGRLNEVSVSGNYSVKDAAAAIRTLTEAAGGQVTHLPGGFLILR